MGDDLKIETVYTWHTGYCADSVEWCPIESYVDFFVCGTYQLDKSDGENSTRIGRIYLFNSNSGETPIQTIETVGVLDQKWCNYTIDDRPTLAVVNADGKLQIYSLEGKLKFITEIDVGSFIVTSVDWSNNKLDGVPNVVVTDTKGGVSVFSYGSSTLEKIASWKAHDYETWICAFDCWKPSAVFTGGDDCTLKLFDVRGDGPQCTIRRDAGVTSLHFNIDQEHIFVSGSYDEIMCVRDTRMLKRSIGEINLGGGIWRLKWDPIGRKRILAACMLNGFSIVDCDDLQTPKLLAKYDEHESLAYGADWSHKPDPRTIATCSFYDCKMNVARIEPK